MVDFDTLTLPPLQLFFELCLNMYSTGLKVLNLVCWFLLQFLSNR